MASREIVPVAIDVFYCSDVPDEADNQVRAARMFDNASALAKQNIQINGKPIDRIRMRSLPAAVNVRESYGIAGDEIRFDANDQNEMAWTGVLASKISPNASLRGIKRKTPGYISVFACSAGDLAWARSHSLQDAAKSNVSP